MMNGLFQDGLKPCISGDIWGENYVSLLAVMVHWIDGSWQLMKRLVICEPYGKVSHTGENILQTTKRRLAGVNVGELVEADDLEGVEAVDTVYESIFSKVRVILDFGFLFLLLMYVSE